MHYFLSISLERFYSETLIGAEPSLSSRPLIVHYEKKVLDMNDLAEEAGAKIGMALSEAKALLHGGSFVAWEEEPYRDARNRWLDICTDFTDVIEPDRQNSAYLDFSLHPDPSAVAWRLQKQLFETLGWKSRVGIAGTKWIAKVSEIVNGDGELPLPQLEPCHHPIRFLSNLPTEYLLRVAEIDRMRLKFLGYRQIGEICKVPLSVLREQFGEEGLLIHQASHGGVHQKVSAVYPKDCVSTRIRFESPVDSLETLSRAYLDLAKSLSSALHERDMQGNELELILEFEEGEIEKKRRKFMKPMQSTKAILSSIKLVAAEITQPIGEIRAIMINLEPARRFQRELTGAHTAEERVSSTVAAFNHIRTVFGDHAIEVAGQVREPRRKMLMRFWKDATGWS
ncbi:MAG TPA: hypothetical protein VGL56_06735 [Fimbriimonadaceae bacterium]|jgi:nucleotidyltransferase/DNA polymerase involved in DNA repair